MGACLKDHLIVCTLIYLGTNLHLGRPGRNYLHYNKERFAEASMNHTRHDVIHQIGVKSNSLPQRSAIDNNADGPKHHFTAIKQFAS